MLGFFMVTNPTGPKTVVKQTYTKQIQVPDSKVRPY